MVGDQEVDLPGGSATLSESDYKGGAQTSGSVFRLQFASRDFAHFLQASQALPESFDSPVMQILAGTGSMRL